MGKAIKDKEELKNIEVPEKAEEITKAEAEEQNQPIIEEPVPKVEEAKAEKAEGEWLVETPNPSYTGLNVTIEFKNGKGITKNKVVADHFKAKGYKVTKI